VVLQGHRPEDTALHLDAGWNLVGPVVGTPTPASLRERLWSWDAQTRTYQADGGTLEVGHGYWIHAVAPQDISVP
jgi:hypothetical protein